MPKIKSQIDFKKISSERVKMATKKRKVGIESRVRKPAWEKRILFCKDTLQNNYVLDAKKQQSPCQNDAPMNGFIWSLK